MKGNEIEIARNIFRDVTVAFPDLQTQTFDDSRGVTLGLEIPEQRGLSFKITLTLQDDELHIYAAKFHMSWFPCANKDIEKKYLDAVLGLISGRYRIVEYCRGDRLLKSHLQKPKKDGWKTTAFYWNSWLALLSVWPLSKQRIIIQNIRE